MGFSVIIDHLAIAKKTTTRRIEAVSTKNTRSAFFYRPSISKNLTAFGRVSVGCLRPCRTAPYAAIRAHTLSLPRPLGLLRVGRRCNRQFIFDIFCIPPEAAKRLKVRSKYRYHGREEKSWHPGRKRLHSGNNSREDIPQNKSISGHLLRYDCEYF